MVAENAVEGAGSEMNAKAGRKALLLGYLQDGIRTRSAGIGRKCDTIKY